jgi:transposase InsO family protein
MTTPTMPQTDSTTMTAAPSASIYQQLKGHLAELLPRVLDQAQAEGWSLTQTLEHLLAVEVTATNVRRLAGRFYNSRRRHSALGYRRPNEVHYGYQQPALAA